MKVVKITPAPKELTLATSKAFGELIRYRRTSLGLTRETAAQLSNMNTQTLAKIENGNELVGLNNALKIAKELGIQIHFSIGEDQ